MSLQPIKVNMLILMCNDLVPMIEYYKKFGFELKFQVPEKWAEFDVQGIKLGIAQTAYELPERRTGMVFEVSDLYQFYATAQEQGIQFLSEPVQAVHGIIASFKDPGNNILDLYQPMPERVKDFIKKAAQEEKNCCGDKENCQCKKNDTCCSGH